MPRTIWKGSISFGLVQIPVGLYSAEKADELSFNLLTASDHAPVGYKRYNKNTGEEIEWSDAVKGYELESGDYVVLTDEDFEAANVRAASTIDIIDFVDVKDIEPQYFDRPYYLAPLQKNNKAFAILRETLKRTGKVGIAKTVLRTREHLAAVMPQGDGILLELLRFAEEIRGKDELELPPEDLDALKVTEKELKMADRLVEDLTDEWDPGKYHDEYRDDILRVIHEKAESGEVQAAGAPTDEEDVEEVDIMSLLKQSLERNGRNGKKAKAKA